jgi:hypothetical protein
MHNSKLVRAAVSLTAKLKKKYYKLDAHESVHRDTTIKITNKMRLYRLIYYSMSTLPDNVHQLHVQQPSTYEKPEAASAVLGS